MALAQYYLSELNVKPMIRIENVIFITELEEPSDELKQFARKELRETPNIVHESTKQLRRLLRKEKNLSCPINCENWCLRFLRPSKFNPEAAFNLIKRYYTFKNKHQNIFTNILPSKQRHVFKHNILQLVSSRDQFNRRIVLVDLGSNWKSTEISLNDVFKGLILLFEHILLEPKTQICGIVIIFQMDGLSITQTAKLKPTFVKMVIDWFQDCAPIRLKNLHVINQSLISSVTYKLFKPYLNEKMKKRVVFHGKNYKTLHQYIDPKCLPECCGGIGKCSIITGNDLLVLLLQCEEEYKAINSFGYNVMKDAKE